MTEYKSEHVYSFVKGCDTKALYAYLVHRVNTPRHYTTE